MLAHRPSHPLVKCSKPLAANASAAPLDVVKMKSALGALGLYEAPEWGVSQFPDAALFDAIKAFQTSQGLKVDGAIKPDGETEAALSQAMTPRRAQTALQATAQALQSLGRGGDELLAHITPEEAALLHHVTDGASVNPQTGLLEFFYGGFGGQPDGGVGGQSGNNKEGSGDGRFDPSADHKANQNNGPSSPSDPSDHGRGQGSEPDGGANGGSEDGNNVGGNAFGALTDTKEKEDNARAQSDNTRTRRASAKEDTLPGDVLGGDGLSKKDGEDEGGMDLTIEDVEKENKAIMEKSKKLAEEAKRKEEEDRKVWHEVPYWSPGLNPTPPTPPQGPQSRWNNNPNPTQDPGEGVLRDPSAPKSRPGDEVAKQIQKSILDKFMEDAAQIARGLGLSRGALLSPMMTLPGFEDAIRKSNQLDYDEEDLI